MRSYSSSSMRFVGLFTGSLRSCRIAKSVNLERSIQRLNSIERALGLARIENRVVILGKSFFTFSNPGKSSRRSNRCKRAAPVDCKQRLVQGIDEKVSTPKQFNLNRRRFVGTAAITIAAAQLGVFSCAPKSSSQRSPTMAQTMTGSSTTAIRPFPHLNVPEAELVDLRSAHQRDTLAHAGIGSPTTRKASNWRRCRPSRVIGGPIMIGANARRS